MKIEIPIRRTSTGKEKNIKTKRRQPLVPPVGKLANASGPECFWVNNGPIVKNLVELRDAVKEMDDAKFKYHALGADNDFAVWIEFVLNEPKLAKQVRRARSRRGFVKALEKNIGNIPDSAC